MNSESSTGSLKNLVWLRSRVDGPTMLDDGSAPATGGPDRRLLQESSDNKSQAETGRPNLSSALEKATQPHRDAGLWLKELRAASNLTQRQLAEKVGAKYYTLISQLEAGWGSIPLERSAAWAEAFGVEPREFVVEILRRYYPAVYSILFA